MRAWRREKAWFREATVEPRSQAFSLLYSPLRMLASDNYARGCIYGAAASFYHVMRAARVIKRHRVALYVRDVKYTTVATPPR